MLKTNFENLPARKAEALRTAKALWEEGEAKEQFHLEKLGAPSKGIVAIAKNWVSKGTAPLGFGKNSLFLVFYPRPEHAEAFVEASQNLTSMGPSNWLPGAVGALHAQLTKNIEGRRLTITMLQGCYYQKDSKALTRAIVTKYGGWRQHLFTAAFEKAEKNGLRTVKFNDSVKQSLQSSRAFKEIAQKRGYRVVEIGHLIEAHLD